MRQHFLAVVLAILPALAAGAQPSPGAAPADSGNADLLGAPFENEAAGIRLRLPVGMHRVRASGVGDDLGQFADEHRQWQLKLTRITTTQPTYLDDTTDNYGNPVQGLLNRTVARVKIDLPGSTVLRQDLTNTRDGDPQFKNNVAMIAVRYTATGARYLTQQAIIQSNRRMFYLLALTTPASNATGAAADNDPLERPAVTTFAQVLDSVRLLDTNFIKKDQDQRFLRTYSMLTNWTSAKIHSVLVDEQWIRIVQNGRDIGYSYITEQPANGVPRPLRLDEVKAGKSDRDLVQSGDGTLVGVRSRTLNPSVDTDPGYKPIGDVRLDTATWMYVGADRRMEDWSRIVVVEDLGAKKDGKSAKMQTEEFGTSSRETIRSLIENGTKGEGFDRKQPPVTVLEQYTLNVRTVTPSGEGEPVSRVLGGLYLPQALSHLAPRLLPLRPQIGADGIPEVRKYIFAVYVPQTREVMRRYMDVGPEQPVKFAGRTFAAVPVYDRIGWAGSVTVHYLTPGGKYLGSEDKGSKTLMIPTDAATLTSIWKDANLTRPGGVNLRNPDRDKDALPGVGRDLSLPSTAPDSVFGPK
jgi:hypothetical protein